MTNFTCSRTEFYYFYVILRPLKYKLGLDKKTLTL